MKDWGGCVAILIYLVVVGSIVYFCSRQNHKDEKPKQESVNVVVDDEVNEKQNSYSGDWGSNYSDHYEEIEEMVIDNMRENYTDEELVVIFGIDPDHLDRKKIKQAKKKGVTLV